LKIVWKKVSDAQPGEVLADNVYDGSGFVVLLKAGTKLWDEGLELLKVRGVKFIPVCEGEFVEQSPVTENLIVPEAPEVIENYDDIILSASEITSKLIQTGVLEFQKLQNVTNEIVENIARSSAKILNILRSHTRGFLFKHTVNVAIISVMISRELNWSRYNQILISQASLLHDIGLAFLGGFVFDLDTEDLRVRTHPILSVETLSKYTEMIPSSVVRSILEHHEHYDGSGYPMGIKGDALSEFSRILQVSDAFDTLTTKDLTGCSMSPYHALKWIVNRAGSYFDPVFVSAFISVTGIYPTGTSVCLSDGSRAVVLSPTKKRLQPVVMRDREIIDLSKGDHLWVTGIAS